MQGQARLATPTCYAAFLALGMCGTMLGPTFDNLAQRFSIPLSQSGIFVSLQFIGAILAVVVAGRLLDRIQARYVLCGGALLMGGGLLMLGAAPSLPVALLGAAILGMGYGTLDVSPNVVVAALNPDRAGSALNALNVFFSVGAIVGPQVVNFAESQHNFRLAYTATAVFSLLLVIPFAMIRLRVQGDRLAAQNTSIRWMTLLPFAVLMFAYVGAEVGFGSWIVTQLTAVARSSKSTGTVGASIFWTGMAVGRALASVIMRRMRDEQLLLLAILILGGGVLLLLLMPTIEPVAIASAFIVGFGCGPIFPNTIAIVGNHYPEARGRASGVLMAAGNFGAIILPWLQGQVGNGLSGGMIVIFIAAVVMLVAMLPILVETRRARTA